jgi:N-acetylglucosamine repressor
MSAGRLLKGHSGLAGEIGHIPVVEGGRPCGCGGRGCLETVASDSSFAWRVSQKLGRKVSIDDALERARSDPGALAGEMEDTCRYLALGVAAVLNLFNPSTLFIHGRIFEADESLFDQLVELVGRRALPPSFADCRIVQARGSKRQGAVAGIIQHLTSAIGPALEGKSL